MSCCRPKEAEYHLVPIAFVSLNDTCQSKVNLHSKHDGSAGNHSEQMGGHASIQTSHTFLPSHQFEALYQSSILDRYLAIRCDGGRCLSQSRPYDSILRYRLSKIVDISDPIVAAPHDGPEKASYAHKAPTATLTR